MKFPSIVLWAWERPVDLEWADPEKFAVAFLAQTVILTGDQVKFRSRRNPLKVAPETKLIAVTRIESDKTGDKVSLSDNQKEQLVTSICQTFTRPQIYSSRLRLRHCQGIRKARALCSWRRSPVAHACWQPVLAG